MSDEENTELTDFELLDILKFYKNKYAFDLKDATIDIADIMLPEIQDQRQPAVTAIVDENEIEFSNIMTEKISFDQANKRLDIWLKALDERERYKVAQIIQEIARDTLVKEIDSGEEFMRDLLNEHKELMFDILDPEIRRTLVANESSYVMNFVTTEVERPIPNRTKPNTLTKEQTEDMLAAVLDNNPEAVKYIKKLTENRNLKKELLKDMEIDSILSGGKNIKDILNNKNNNCLKEDNDLKNLRITLNESLQVFEEIDIKDEEWKQLKENYKDLSLKIAEQEVIKNELASMQKKCNIM